MAEREKRRERSHALEVVGKPEDMKQLQVEIAFQTSKAHEARPILA